jgi:hypothetical protein
MKMSAVAHLPAIAATDYEAFVDLLKDQIPASYEEWRQRHQGED